MYVPPLFSEPDPEILQQIMRENGFALLVSATDEGPFATHLPMIVDVDGQGRITIAGHMAKANPHWQALDRNPEALIVFSGPHAYVSPSWYANHPAVPTWNYVAVHAYGRVTTFADPAELDRLLAALTATHEGDRDGAWRYDALPADFRDRQIKGIVGFRMSVERLEGKLKLSQNRPADDAQRVTERLGASDHPGDRATAAAMRRFVNRDGGNDA